MFFGPVVVCALSAVGFCMSYEDTPDVLKWIYVISYFRAGFHMIAKTMLGFGRKKLYCPFDEMYCHFGDPEDFLKKVSMYHVNFKDNMILISVMGAVLFVVTYFGLWLKMQRR